MLEIYYMIVHLTPQEVYTVITSNDFKYLNIEFKDNLLLRLPQELLAQWLSFNRLGTFIFEKSSIPIFSPGVIRPDIYCPILESFPVFEIANILHELQIVNHFEFIMCCMYHRVKFVAVFSEQITLDTIAVDGIFKSKCSYKNTVKKTKIRTKRKLRFSISKAMLDTDFLNYLSKKGHTKWCLLN